jgi:general secretion pathway protein G
MRLRPTGRAAALAAPRPGFTLLEVLIVVAIIVVLAGASSVYYLRFLEDAKEGKAKNDAAALAQACQAFQLQQGRFPESLNELLTPPGGGKPYIEPGALNDPWGNPYQYDPDGPRNNNLKPDVFTTNPSSGAVVGNFTNR